MAALAFAALAAMVISHLSSWLAAPLIVITEKIQLVNDSSGRSLHPVPRGFDPFAALLRLVREYLCSYYIVLGFLIVALARWDPLVPPWTKRTAEFSPGTLRVGLLACAGLISVIVLHPFQCRGALMENFTSTSSM